MMTRRTHAIFLATLMVASGILHPAAAQITIFSHDPSGSLTNVTQSAGAVPAILTPPVSKIVSQSGNVTFSVGVNGAGPLSYQWLSNGVPVAGATGDALTISNIVVPQNVLTNGGFESPQEIVAYLTYVAPANIGAWIVETGTVDHVFTAWEPAEGFQSIDLNGTSGGAIYRDVPTSIGQQYYLHFALAGNYGNTPLTKTNEVWWNESPIDTNTFVVTGHSATDMGWTNLEYLVTATNITTRIRFASRVAGAAGSALDNVTLFPVPPPPPQFSVIVSNASGSVTSAVATIQFDTDRNGLPDAWERQYFGGVGHLADDDTDADGVSNLDEFFDGTDPTSAASLKPRLRVTVVGNGAVVVSPLKAAYAYSENVQITAIANSDSLFVGWHGAFTNPNPVLNLTMTNSKTFAAIFGATLTNGGNHFGLVTPYGTSIYALTANSGDTINLRCGEVSGSPSFAPNIDLFGPNGPLVATTGNGSDAALSYRTTTSGVFRVEVSSYYAGEDGTYRLTLAQAPTAFVVAPGDEGGGLTNGLAHAGTNDIGDEDLWSFSANAGDTVTLRAGKVSGSGTYAPWIRLYATNGALLSSDANYNDAIVSFRMTNSGTFNVVVGAYYPGYTGDYQLTFAKAPGTFAIPPGDEGGQLTNGGNHDGVTTMGDEDMWSVAANSGDTLVLRCAKTAGSGTFAPWVRLYNTNGVLLASDADYNDSYLTFRATNSGTFSVLVGAYYQGYTGNYRLRLAKIPGPFIVPPGDEGGLLAARTNYDAATDVGDEDMWTFTGYKSSPFSLTCTKLSGPSLYAPWMRLYSSSGELLINTTAAQLNYTPASNATFTVLVGCFYPGYSGTYRLVGTNVSDGLRLFPPAIAGTNLNVTSTGGGSNVLAVLYSTTNLGQPFSQWTPIRTNRFDTFGVFVFTNLYNPSAREQYFRLIVP